MVGLVLWGGRSLDEYDLRGLLLLANQHLVTQLTNLKVLYHHVRFSSSVAVLRFKVNYYCLEQAGAALGVKLV